MLIYNTICGYKFDVYVNMKNPKKYIYKIESSINMNFMKSIQNSWLEYTMKRGI